MRLPRLILLFVVAIGLAACSVGKPKPVATVFCLPTDEGCPEIFTPDADTTRPKPRPMAMSAPLSATAAALDTTSTAEKEAAVESASSGERELGRTIASLGDVTDAGFWLKTPLVEVETEGRIILVDGGSAVNVTLIPNGGEAGGGSQISLPAMRILGVSLTDLPELIVVAR